MHTRLRPGAAGRSQRRRAPRWLLLGALVALLLAVAPAAAAAGPVAGAFSWSAPPLWQTAGAAVGVTALVKAPAGGAYAVGYQNTAAGGKTVRVRRFSKSGSLVWSALLRGLLGKGAWANDAAADHSGNLYVAGGSVATHGSVAMLAKFSPAGRLLWRRALPTVGSAPDEATALAIDGTGSVYICAVVRSHAKLGDIVTAKFSPAGKRVWSYTYATKRNDRPAGIALDSSGNVYVTGLAASSSATTGVAVLLKIVRTGHGVWTRTIGHRAPLARVQGLFVVTRSTAVWVAGQVGSGARDVFVARFTASGRTQVFNDVRAVAGDDVLRGFVVDTAGNAYLAGYSRMGLTPKAGFIARYTPTGVAAWDSAFANTVAGGPFDTAFTALALGPAGSVYAAGLYGLGAGKAQAVVARFSTADGSQTKRWSMGGTDGTDAFGPVLVAAPSLVYTAGGRSGAGKPAYVQRLVP